jgi:hypothetical protein
MIAELIARLRGDSSSWDAMMNRATRSVSDFKGHVGSIAPAVAGAFGAAGAMTFAKSMFETGAEIEKMARTAGMTAEGIQRMNFAAKETDTSVESLDKSLARMQRNQAEALKKPNGPQADAFADLGITIADLEKLGPEELFEKMADGVKDATSQASALDDVMTILGRSGVDTFNMLAQGSTRIKELMAQAKVLSDTDVASLAESNRALTEFQNNLEIVGMKFAQGLSRVVGSIGLAVATPFLLIERTNAAMDRGITHWSDQWHEAVSIMKSDWKSLWSPDAPAAPKLPSDNSALEDAGTGKAKLKTAQELARAQKQMEDETLKAKLAGETLDQKRLEYLQRYTAGIMAIQAVEHNPNLSADEKRLATVELVKTKEADLAEIKKLNAEISKHEAEDAARKLRYADEQKKIEAEITEMVDRRNLLGLSSAQRLQAMQKEYNGLVKESLALAGAGKTKEAREKERDALRVGLDMEQLEKEKESRRGGETIANEFQRRGSLEKGMMLLPKTDPVLLTVQQQMAATLKSIDQAVRAGNRQPTSSNGTYGE